MSILLKVSLYSRVWNKLWKTDYKKQCTPFSCTFVSVKITIPPFGTTSNSLLTLLQTIWKIFHTFYTHPSKKKERKKRKKRKSDISLTTIKGRWQMVEISLSLGMKAVPNVPTSCPQCLLKISCLELWDYFFLWRVIFQGNYTIHNITEIMYICKEKIENNTANNNDTEKQKLTRLIYTSNYLKKNSIQNREWGDIVRLWKPNLRSSVFQWGYRVSRYLKLRLMELVLNSA